MHWDWEILAHHLGGPITEVVLLLRWSYYRGGPITEVVLLLSQITLHEPDMTLIMSQVQY